MGIDTILEPKMVNCPHCGRKYEFTPIAIAPNHVPPCDPCAERQEETWAARKQPRTWEERYQAMLPPGYLTSDPGRIPACYAGALAWKSVTHRAGVGLIGPSGLGKSSAIACLLRQMGHQFLWWSGTQARSVATEAAMAEKADRADACREWQRGMEIPILVLDDITQGTMTEAWSPRLFDLLETRLSRGLPTLWTSQIPLEDFRTKIEQQTFGNKTRAEAVSRRLGQLSLVLKG